MNCRSAKEKDRETKNEKGNKQSKNIHRREKPTEQPWGEKKGKEGHRQRRKHEKVNSKVEGERE